MKTLGKTMILTAVAITALAMLVSEGWIDDLPTIQKLKYAFVEVISESDSPDRTPDMAAYSNALTEITARAIDEFPERHLKAGEAPEHPSTNEDLINFIAEYNPAYDINADSREQYIRGKLIERGLLIPGEHQNAVKLSIRSIITFSILLLLAGVFLVWR